MSTCVILNPRAGSASQSADLEEALSRRRQTVVRVTEGPGDAARIASMAGRAGFDLVIAAGGDGTTNEVVNGLLAVGDVSRITLGVIPLGTGNDLPRTLGLPLADPLEALHAIESGQRRQLDVARAQYEGRSSYFINVAAGGFSGEVDEAMTAEVKQRWGPLAYLRSAVSVLPDMTHYDTWLSLDGAEPQPFGALNVIVANCRTAGGGLAVAPYANPEDGLLDVVSVHPGSVLELTGVATRLLAGNYINSDVVSMRRARTVRIESHPGMSFNIDGELITDEAVAFSVLPRALRVAVGPDYRAEVEPG